MQIPFVVNISGYTLEILFQVVPDIYLKSDIMIGREILSLGFDVSITRDSCMIRKTNTIEICNRIIKEDYKFE